ncbi:universal stress protein [Zeaxanthinibacter sp. PT1]|uniref:universal stress protein n=1 Tax=Zeaxanthinibacter TaxID=561554 RepID=UPI00234A2D20|nr:universal stress protein [Zeaxanthinibacter sp. PT1]MDC6351932.1 universal stress protein [Zeaxanthinibacter sp. PT1]
MMKIILPTDFSENSFNAIRYAIKLFENEEVIFYLMHTYTPAVYRPEYVLEFPGQIGLGDVLQQQAQEKLKAAVEKLESEFNNPLHSFIPHEAFNTLVAEILEMTVNEGAHMVIMGTQGATGAKEIFLGSNSAHVVKRSTCPVILIPNDFEYEHLTEVLFPTDFEISYDQHELAPLINLVKMHGSSIEVLHIATGYPLAPDQKAHKEQLDRVLKEVPHLFHELPPCEIIDGINQFQIKTKVNMLAMIRNKHTFFERLFIDPVIKKLAFHIKIPFMVMPHTNPR